MFRTLILAGASAMALSLAGNGIALAAATTQDNTNHQTWSGAKPEHAQQSSQQGANGMNTTKGEAGVSRDQIKQAQQKLQSDGLYNGKVDGRAGPETQQALKQFQQKNQLQQTGQLDQQTAQKPGIST